MKGKKIKQEKNTTCVKPTNIDVDKKAAAGKFAFKLKGALSL